MVALGLILAGATATASAASAGAATSCGTGYADDPGDQVTTDLVCIPDSNLLSFWDTFFGETSGSPITVAQARSVGGSAADITVGVGDLTGMQMFTSPALSGLDFIGPGNTFTDLTPLAGLTNLTSLSLSQDADLTNVDLTPVDSMTRLQSLSVSQDSQITSLSAISDMAWLSTLNLVADGIGDAASLASLPDLPNATSVNLSQNEIADPSTLATKLADAVNLATLSLSNNQIADASSLASLGVVGTILGSTGTLNLSGNQIKDFSAFSGWSKPPDSTGQAVYVGPYTTSGVTVKLATATGTAPSVSAGAGSYDPATGLLTLSDPTAASVAVSPDWTVNFSYPPGDPGAPVISDTTPQVGQQLSTSVTAAGSALADCTTISYRWLRDGAPFTGNPYWVEDHGNTNTDSGAALIGTDIPMGDPGVASGYVVGVTDLGHVLSVRATCQDTTGPDAGVSVTSAVTAPVTSGYAAEQPMIQTLQGLSGINNPGGAAPQIIAAPRSGVVGDPTNPTLPVYVAQLDANGNRVDPSQLSLIVSSATGTLSGAGGVTITTDPDNPAERTIHFNPQGVGGASATLSLTGTTGLTTTFDVSYASSMATTPTSRVLEGSSDDSTAIDAGNGYFFVGDDEKDNIRLYNGAVSGREVAQFSPFAGAPIVGELDLEASAQEGSQDYFFGSEGNNKKGQIQASRNEVFEMTQRGTGANATLTPVTEHGGFADDLSTWDQAHGNMFGLATARDKGILPEQLNGFDLEGAEFSPNGSELYVGMRAPIYPATPGGDAVIFTVTNFDAVMAAAKAGQDLHWQFGDPILLNLGGQSIREIRKNADNQYLIISGQAGTEGASGPSGPAAQTLWAWDGQPGDQPQRLSTTDGTQVSAQASTSLPADLQPVHELGEEAGGWEGIADMPDPLSSGATVRLLMDQGFDQDYGDGIDNKDQTSDYVSAGRTDEFTLSGPVGTVADLSDPGTFGYQAPDTIGPPKTITVTNGGSDPLHVGRISTTDDDQVSASDFLITNNQCHDQTLAIGDSCTVQVRFAPSGVDTVSDARLVVASDVPGGQTTMALTGTTVPQALAAATPTMSGTAKVGDRLTAKTGTWTAGTRLTFQWLRNGTAIRGATGSAYTPVAADAGTRLAVRVTGTKTGYAAASRTSATRTVTKGTLHAATPRIRGTATVGKTLTVVPGTWTGGTRVTFQWRAGGKAIAGRHGRTLKLAKAQAGKKITVQVTGTKTGYTTLSRTSPATAKVRQ